MKKILLIGILSTCFFCTNAQSKQEERTYVVVLSMDAFRWDYAKLIGTPNLDKIAKKGVKTYSWQPCFPSITFPNHYSMATGLHPNNHGIVHNTFYNKYLNKTYRISDRNMVENPDFYGGEPIWNTAMKQGKRTANFYWVGSEAPVQGMQPNTWKTYDEKISFETRIDSVISWMQRPEEQRPDLVMFYFEEPDATTHHDDPVNGERTKAMVKRCDSLVGVLDCKLQALPFASNIHLIIVSDHGMCPVAQERSVYLEDYIPDHWINFSNWGTPCAIMDIRPDKIDSAILVLKNVDHLSAWKNTEVPERLHYGSNPNIGNLVIVADSAWNIFRKRSYTSYDGAHGFDNNNMDMHGIFYAYGPKFKKGFTAPTLQNIQLYNIISHLLNLKPAKNDGKIEEIMVLFK